MCDAYYWRNFVAGGAKRLGCPVPPIEKDLLREFRGFVRAFVDKHFLPLGQDEIPSLEEWLADSHYSDARRSELRAAAAACPVIGRDQFRCASFIKTECYDGYKYPRLINSRTDAFKAFTGPLFHAIERRLFDPAGPTGKFFVKKIPVAERSRFIFDRLFRHGGTYLASDYTAFEALFAPEFFRACEFQLYARAVKNLPERTNVLRVIQQALAGQNRCAGKLGSLRVNGCRMSGDMCTSLGNGFSNLMLMLFTCHKLGSKVDGVVEGDDGLFVVDGRVPTTADFAKLGFHIKLVASKDLGEAGFCKQFFGESKENLADPAAKLAGFGWTHSCLRYSGPGVMDALLRAKADSLLAEFPNAPVLTALGNYARRISGPGRRAYGGKGGAPTWWEAETLARQSDECVNYNIPPDSRLVVERLFKVPVTTQLAIEDYLNQLTKLTVLDHEAIRSIMKPQWADYYDKFVVEFGPGQHVDF